MFRRILTYFGLGVAALAVLGIGAGVAYLVTVTSGLPSVDSLRHYEPRITTRVYAGNGTVLGEYARERRIFVPIEFVPNRVKQAFTSAEDRNFYNHPGVDPSGILRAAIKDVSLVIQRRRPQGASTITQQVARIFLLNSDLKFSRKIREAILAVRIDATYPKDKVLELYLNEIYLGGNSYGVAAAALNYFGKSLDELSIQEVAFLAALPKGPANYDPRRYYDAAVERRNWVIDQMVENKHISRAEGEKAKAEPLVAQSRPMGSQAADVDYYVEQVRRQLYSRYGQNALYDGGLQVRASLDTRLQNYAVSALRSGLVRYDRRHGWRGAKQHIAIDGDWKKALAVIPSRSGVETWKLSVVLGYDARNIRIGFADGATATIPFEGYRWARRQIGTAGAVGPAPTTPQEVASRAILSMSNRWSPIPRPAWARTSSACVRCRRSTAPSWRWTRTPAACWRCRAASPTPPPNSTAPCRRCVSPARPSSPSSMPRRWTMATRPPPRCWMRPSSSTWGRGRASGGRRISRSASIWAKPRCAAAWSCRTI